MERVGVYCIVTWEGWVDGVVLRVGGCLRGGVGEGWRSGREAKGGRDKLTMDHQS